jgi:hypothetical protein
MWCYTRYIYRETAVIPHHYDTTASVSAMAVILSMAPISSTKWKSPFLQLQDLETVTVLEDRKTPGIQIVTKPVSTYRSVPSMIGLVTFVIASLIRSI